ncbi:MAG: hypothetical protein WD578_03925 [Bacteroidales bacterium]
MIKSAIVIFIILLSAQCSDDKPIPPEYAYPNSNVLRDLPLDSLKVLAAERVDRVKDNPEGRYLLREEFYRMFGHGRFSRFGFGDSELAFIKWETRGVLHPPDADPPGSPWWGEVNLEFIYWSELAALIHLAEIQINEADIPVPVHHWLQFIDEPSSKHWYRAHNSSIIGAYYKFAHLAEQEIHPEQVFINMVLYRLLYAQAMVEAEHFAFGKLGQFLADPRGFAVNFIVHDPFFYPSSYPLTTEEQQIILGQIHSIGELEVEFMDDVLILPHLEELYQTVSIINDTPELMHFINDGKPVYPEFRE